MRIAGGTGVARLRAAQGRDLAAPACLPAINTRTVAEARAAAGLGPEP
jgi:hypothetical protein